MHFHVHDYFHNYIILALNSVLFFYTVIWFYPFLSSYSCPFFCLHFLHHFHHFWLSIIDLHIFDIIASLSAFPSCLSSCLSSFLIILHNFHHFCIMLFIISGFSSCHHFSDFLSSFQDYSSSCLPSCLHHFRITFIISLSPASCFSSSFYRFCYSSKRPSSLLTSFRHNIFMISVSYLILKVPDRWLTGIQ
jgi:hypothetical protein